VQAASKETAAAKAAATNNVYLRCVAIGDRPCPNGLRPTTGARRAPANTPHWTPSRANATP